MADALMDISATSIPADEIPTELPELTALGSGDVPAGLAQSGALSADEWQKAGEAQRTIDRLYSKWPLSGDEIKRLDEAQAQRNALWSKAVSVPGLSAEERERLRLDFHVRASRSGDSPPAVVGKDTLEKWSRQEQTPAKEPATSAPVPVTVNPVTSHVLREFLVNRPTAGVEFVGQNLADTVDGGDSFGNVLGVAKIAVAYKTEGAASARAATADFLVGLIPYPQASFAVDGGREATSRSYRSSCSGRSERKVEPCGHSAKDSTPHSTAGSSSRGRRCSPRRSQGSRPPVGRLVRGGGNQARGAG